MTGVSVAVRAAGVVVALPFLAGLLPGSVAAAGLGVVAAGLARAVGPPGRRFFSTLAVPVYAGAVAVGVARWATLDLGELRGVQAVLGPTVTVGPDAAAAAGLAAGIAGAIALGLWLGAPRPIELWMGEALAGGLLLVTVFWGPALPGLGAPGTFGRAAGWVALTAGVASGAGAVGASTAAGGKVLRYGLLVTAALVVAASAITLEQAL